jgi:phosphoribosylformylglycinamidine (FGAM) synthase PurS component
MSDIHEIRVFGEHDPTADAIQKQAEAMLGINIALTTARVFRVEGVDSEEATKLAEKLFSDPLTQDIEIGDRQDWDNSKTVEVAPLIGMMNPEAESIIYGAELLGVRPAAVDSSTEYRFTDRTSDTVISEVIRRVAMNEKVERIMVDTPDTLQITGKVGPIE